MSTRSASVSCICCPVLEEVVAPGGGYLQGPLGVLLAADVAEVQAVHSRVFSRRRVVGGVVSWKDIVAPQVIDKFRKGLDGNNLDPAYQCGLSGVHGRDEHRLEPLVSCQGHHWQDTVGVPQVAVQRKFPKEKA